MSQSYYYKKSYTYARQNRQLEQTVSYNSLEHSLLEIMKSIARTTSKIIYNSLVRDKLPKKMAMFNSVGVRDIRLFDINDSFPNYENSLIQGIRNVVSSNDSVVIVGGGRGVSTVISARLVGRTGHVITYEASNTQVDVVKETVTLNQVTDRVSVTQALVGDDINVWGDFDKADHIEPENIPTCDVLILDCEGTEKDILTEMNISPRSIVVETHGHYDSPTALVKQLLKEKNYNIEHISRMDDEKDMSVVTASSS